MPGCLKTTHIRIKFVQFQKNTAHHVGIKCSTYSALFGCDARIGLISLSLPQEIIERMQSEDDLIALVTAPASSQTPSADQQPAYPEPFSDLPFKPPASPDLPSAELPPVFPGRSADLLSSSSLPFKYLPNSHHPVTDGPAPAAVVEEHKKEIKRKRIEASAGKFSQAERMVKRSHIQCKPGSP